MTPGDVRERLAEAVDVLRRMPMPRGCWPAGYPRISLDVVPDAFAVWMRRGYLDEKPEKGARTVVRPTPVQIDRAMEAIAWLLWLDEPWHRQALMMSVWVVSDSGRTISARRIGLTVRKAKRTVEDWNERNLKTLAVKLNEKGYPESAILRYG